MNDIQAIIVTWNSGETIARCLDSCRDLTVTVVDNASSDDTVEIARRYPNVYLISNRENRGFAAAANQGIARSGADYILLLNPDVELSDSIEPLRQACAAGASIAAGRLVDAAGRTQKGFTVRRLPSAVTLAFEALGINRVFPWNAVNRRYRCLDVDLNSPADVEQPAGAFLFFSRKLWADLGGFDELFFPVWFEDVDFCKRALARGRIRYVPSVAARHVGGRSIAHLDWSSREQYWYVSLLKYASKHFTRFAFRGVCGAVVLGSALRWVTAVFDERKLSEAIKTYASIVDLAIRCTARGRVLDPPRVESYQERSVRTITSSTE